MVRTRARSGNLSAAFPTGPARTPRDVGRRSLRPVFGPHDAMKTMAIMPMIAGLALLLLLWGCHSPSAPAGDRFAPASNTVTATTATLAKVTVADVLLHKEDYQGKRVEIVGFYRSHFEYSAIYQDGEERETKRGVWIDFFAKPGHEDKVKWIDNGFVRIVGKFEFRPGLGVGHLGGWPAKLTDIELFEEVRW